MYFFTHLYISKTLYHLFSDKVDLNKRAFAYGNIKPDLPSSHRKHHTLENYLFVVRDKSRLLINNPLTEKEYSICLGEICHYVCDFFCYYHTNDKLHQKLLKHFFYELFMHFNLIKMGIRHKLTVVPEKEEPRKDFLTIILEMRKLYFLNSMKMETDINFAFASCIWICESIFYSMQQESNQLNTSLQNLYITYPLGGGSL